MVIVSNNLLTKTNINFPAGTIIRVNVAWQKSAQLLRESLDNLNYIVYLDYPRGRTKPPTPRVSLEDTIQIANDYLTVKYFAVSNVEDPDTLNSLKTKLRDGIELVPKIETREGIKNLVNILSKTGVKYVMLDKEDLYLDIRRDGKLFESLVELTRQICKQQNVELLELQGVVFC